MKPTILGVGIRDIKYPTRDKNGKACPYYLRWTNMLKRAYCPKFLKSRPTYQDCSVCEEWLTFSNFKRWMESQDWEGKVLDKDLLSLGSKIYSPDTCLFVSQSINSFVLDKKSCRGLYPLGVNYDRGYRAYCNNPFTRKHKHLGRYDTPEEAHKAWQLAKWEYGRELLSKQTDPRVIQAMHVILHRLGEDWAAGRETESLIPAKTP